MRVLSFLASFLLLLSLAASQQKSTKSLTLYIAGMHCENCAAKVDKALKGIEGVGDVSVNLNSNSAKVSLASNSAVTTDALIKAVSDAGYEASLRTPKAGTVTAKKEKHDEKEDCDEEGCCTEKDAKDAKAKKSETESKHKH